MKYLPIIAGLLVFLHVEGQNQWVTRRDSLLKQLNLSREDTGKVNTWIRLGSMYLENQPDSADECAKAFGQLSERLHYPRGIAYSLSMQATVLSGKDKQEEAIALHLKAIDVAERAHLVRILPDIYNNAAIVYIAKFDYPSGLNLYLKAQALYEERKDSPAMAMMDGNISGLYQDLNENGLACVYALRGIALCRYLHQTRGFGPALVNLSSALINLKRFDTALVVLKEVKAFAIANNDVYEEINALDDMDKTYISLQDYDPLKSNAEELLRLAKAIDSQEALCYGAYGLTHYYLSKKAYKDAGHWAQIYLKDARAIHQADFLKDAYNTTARVELVKGNIAGFDYYNNLADSVEANHISDKILKNTQELDAKYSLSKKDAQIDLLNKEQKIQQLTLRQRTLVAWLSGGALLALLMVALLISWNYRQKRRLLIADTQLQQNRIRELENERQLLAAEAVLQGQVEERTRLARDLHDGLGGILSSVKHSFSNVKGYVVASPAYEAAFAQSMGILDKSIRELRRVAHNMMPEGLDKFGLDSGLKDFLAGIGQSAALDIGYQSFDIDESSIPKTTATAVFRIIQELVNNILKHAHATTVLVQLVRRDRALSITVEDNGRGFDPANLINSDGIGYANLRNRVAYLNGLIDIQSSADKGTSVNIEIPDMTV
jgi:two-component system, NarL family, sensor kinase